MHRKARFGRTKLDGKQLEEQFEAFLKESISSEESSLETSRIAKFLDSHKKDWWSVDEQDDDDDDDDGGLLGTGRQFLKSKKLDDISETIGERKPSDMGRTTEVHMSKDSLEDESYQERMASAKGNAKMFSVPTLNLGSSPSCTDSTTGDVVRRNGRLGAETLAEIHDKETFFKELEKSTDRTIDYAKLNKELDGSGTVVGTLKSDESNALVCKQPESAVKSGRDQSEDEDGDEDEDEENQNGSISPESRQAPPRVKHIVDSNMLANVALLDSLDSTLGTRPGASREAREDGEMSAIPEGVIPQNVDNDKERDANRDDDHGYKNEDDYYQDHSGYKTCGPKFVVDGRLTLDAEEKRGPDSMTTRGATLKTTTVNNTDTSREIEALHQALRQVGMATLDTTRDFSLKDSSRMQESDHIDSLSKTAGFGLKQMAPNLTDPSERTVGDILREVEELSKKSAAKDDIAVFGMTTTAFLQKINEEAENKHLANGHDEAVGQLFDEGNITIPGKDALKSAEDVMDKKGKRMKDGRYALIKSSGYGKLSPAKSHLTKPPIAVIKSPVAAKQTHNVTVDMKQRQRANSRLTNENKLLESVESLSQYIHTHLQDNSKSKDEDSQVAFERVRSLVSEVSHWQSECREERRIQNKLKASLEAMEKDYKGRIEELEHRHHEELFKLKQENYVLSAKVANKEEPRRPAAGHKTEASGQVMGDEAAELRRLRGELSEQETLLSGFQRENERLYEQQRAADKQGRATRDAMFHENQKLKADMSLLREALERKQVELQHKGLITGCTAQQQIASGAGATAGLGGAGTTSVMGGVGSATAVLGAARITELTHLLSLAKADAKNVEVTADSSTKDLREKVQQLTRQLSDRQREMGELSDNHALHTKDAEKRYTEEVAALKRKLQWYAENQQLLDRDSQKMKDGQQQVAALRQQLELLRSEAGSKRVESKARLRERTADAHKIQDLERQVREMQTILRRRHPDSLPVLMWAAAAAAAPPADGGQAAPSVTFLETQLRKLEAELEGKDEQAERGLRSLQQKYNAMKGQYDRQIEDIESRLHASNQKLRETERPHTHAGSLQRELETTRDRYKKRVSALEKEMSDLKCQLEAVRNKESVSCKNIAKGSKESEVELQLRVKALQLECTNQEKERQLLRGTIERLQTEKQQLLIEATRNAGRNAGKAAKVLGKKLKSRSRTNLKSEFGDITSEPEPLPVYTQPLARDKEYEPNMFAGRHISDIVRENEELKIQLDQQQLEQHQHRVYAQKFQAEKEASDRCSRENFEDQVYSMRHAHQAEVDRLLSDHALQHSTSKLAQLQSRVDTQQVQIAHLKEQVARGELDAEKLTAVKLKEEALEGRVKCLLDELSEARACHTPEMRHFESLQMKLREVSARQEHRERELSQLISHRDLPGTAHTAELQQQADQWRHLAESKSRETERFRAELDSILDVLRELQRQGVILPSRPVANW